MKGDDCAYAHGVSDLAETIDLRKTAICRGWKNAQCPWPDSECAFAHGHDQLRTRKIGSNVDKLATVPRGDDPMHVSSTLDNPTSLVFRKHLRILKYEPLHLPVPSIHLHGELSSDVVKRRSILFQVG
jgi:hypothetical protein